MNIRKNIREKPLCTKKENHRLTYLALGTGIAFTSTLLTATNIKLLDLSSPLAYAFLAAQLVWFLLVLNHATCALRLAFYEEPPRAAPTGEPLVTVIVPIYKEPPSLIARFTSGLAAQTYRNFRLIVVDDSPPPTSSQLRTVAAQQAWRGRFDLKYIARRDRSGYRGGAIKAGVSAARSEYVAVMDVDHMPLPHMLEEMVSVAQGSPGLDVIVFPQTFPEPRNSIEAASRMGYTFDYSFARKGRSVTNSAFCVGTNWIARRDRILGAGGYDDETIVEDMATSLKLWHPAGLRIGFAESTLAVGTLPRSLSAWRTQQRRWALGAFSLFPRLIRLARRLTPFQVFDYLANIAWYLIGPLTVATSLFPLATLLGARLVRIDSFQEYLVVVMGFTLLQALLFVTPLLVRGEKPGRVLAAQATGVLVAETYTSALIDAATGKRESFKVTPKGSGRRVNPLRVGLELLVPAALLGANLVPLAAFAESPTLFNALLAFWASYNMAWILPAMAMYAADVSRDAHAPRPGAPWPLRGARYIGVRDTGTRGRRALRDGRDTRRPHTPPPRPAQGVLGLRDTLRRRTGKHGARRLEARPQVGLHRGGWKRPPRRVPHSHPGKVARRHLHGGGEAGKDDAGLRTRIPRRG